MTRVTIHRFEHMDVLKNLAKAAKDLTELEFISLPHTMATTLIDIVKSAPGLKKFVVHPEMTLETATQILRTRIGLEHVTLKGLKSSRYSADWTGPPSENLTTLNIHFVNTMQASQVGLRALLGRAPSLQSLSLSDINDFMNPHQGWPSDSKQLPPLTSLVLERISLIGHGFPALPPTLQRLVLKNDTMLSLDGAKMSLLRCRIPELVHLTLSGFSWLSGDTLDYLLDSYLDGGTVRALQDTKPLQSISISGVLENNHGDNSLFNGPDSMFGRSPRILTRSLESLDVATLACNDDEIEHLLTYETALRSIDLSYTNITGASIKMLADRLPTLKTIKADNCTRINGRDSIHYAERKGISVSCQMFEWKGRRKIRYGQ
jgi:F-box/TPR repeat protein Pof3